MTINDTELKTAVDLLMKASADLKTACDALLQCIPASTAPEACEEPKPAVTKEMLKERLTRIANDGYKNFVHSLLESYDAKRLSEVPESRYADLYMDIEDFENAHAE